MSRQAGRPNAAIEGVFRGADVLLALGEAPPIEEVRDFIRARYGLDGALVQLRSERDENYRITALDGTQRLFKLAHPAEEAAIVDFQTRALLHVASVSPTIPLQRLVPSIDGAFETSFAGSDGLARQGRMFTYLSGVPLGSLRQTPRQAAAMGNLAATLDASLSSFRHAAAGHELLWDIKHASRTRELLEHTRSPGDRELCERTLDNFERLTPALAALRKQVIHNDLNPHNVLVDPDDADRVTGIIDFGDMVYAPLINEVAVASAYLVTANEAPLGTVPEFVAGYHAVCPLKPEEAEILPQLIAVRHAITIAITNWRAAKYPDNRDYILRNQQSAVKGLHKLFAIGESAARKHIAAALSAVAP